jgi:uncharacterized delta-60 repeat protein
MSGENPSFLLGRYDADGFLDTTFGKNGLVFTDIANMNVPPGSFGSARMGGLALQDDGKIVAAGFANLPLSPDGSSFALARYETNGALDTSFGNGGIVSVDFGDRFEVAHAVTVQQDGKIVAAGEGTLFGIFPITMVARYNPDGTPDLTFGVGGAARPLPALETNTRANAVSIQADGRIVTAGEGFFFGQSVVHQFAVERFDTTGAFDRTFGKGGLMLANTSEAAAGTKSFDFANAMVIQDDGKILVAGTTEFGTAIDVADVALARFQP